jgi:hypothetical protein
MAWAAFTALPGRCTCLFILTDTSTYTSSNFPDEAGAVVGGGAVGIRRQGLVHVQGSHHLCCVLCGLAVHDVACDVACVTGCLLM